jgi:uncharacterized membrane protein YraQ (UPF0718 family)
MDYLLGSVVVLASVLAFADSLARTRGAALLRGPRLTDATRRALLAILSIGSALAVLPALVPPLGRTVFAFCSVCPLGRDVAGGVDSSSPFPATFLLASWHYAATVLPVFILACLLSGLLAARRDRFRVRGAVAAFGLAALLPVCSCGAVPLGRTMIDRGDTGLRDGLIFLATAPVLSPVILVLAVTTIGPAYALLRVAGAAVIAALAGLLLPAFVVGASDAGTGRACPEVADQKAPGDGRGGGHSGGSALLEGWKILTALVRYALYGVVVGALFASALPAGYVASALGRGVLSMGAAVLVGVPVNMCAGEEILISAPLVGMGAGLGHAVAFSLAGTGICLGSMPLLAAALGRRAMLALIAIYLAGPFAVGLLIEALPF